MTISGLRGIIRERGSHDGMWYSIGGCELLEHIVDVGGFVSLLRGFKRRDHSHKTYISFVNDFSDPVRYILGGSVVFDFNKFNIRITAFHGTHYWLGTHWLYYW
jgi:hypothetical protein